MTSIIPNQKENNQKSNRKDYLTFISVISALAVLTLHTNGCFWLFSSTEMYWKTANIIESVYYFAVPLFFMISGITLMDFTDKYTIKEYFVRRFNKTVIPFLSWSIIAMIAKVALGKIPLNSINLSYIYQGIVDSSFIGIFWFFNSLFIIYLSMPLFSGVDKNKRKSVFSYLVITGMVLNFLLPFLISIFSLEIKQPYSVDVVKGVLIWPPLGWVLDNTEFNKKQKTIIYFFAVLGLVIHATGTYVLSMEAGEVVRTYKGYNKLPCILYSIGIFVLLKDIGKKIMTGKNASIIKWLSNYTFPVYLMQYFFLEFIKHYFESITKSIIYRLGGPFVIIPIIIVITMLLRKIPIIKKIVP